MKIRFGARIRCTRCCGYFHRKRMTEKLGLICLIQSTLVLATKLVWITIQTDEKPEPWWPKTWPQKGELTMMSLGGG
jgi:hypothetical protein